MRKTVKDPMESPPEGKGICISERDDSQRNGYYGVDLKTRYGKINDLNIPVEQNNEFQTDLVEKYRRKWVLTILSSTCIQKRYQQSR